MGIPEAIYLGDRKHVRPYRGDSGIRFERRPKSDDPPLPTTPAVRYGPRTIVDTSTTWDCLDLPVAADDRPRCVALARLLLDQLRARRSTKLPASLLAVEALDGGARDAPALAWSALHSAPDGAAQVVARAVARLVEHGVRPTIGRGPVRGDAMQALHALGVEQHAAYDAVHAARIRVSGGEPPQDVAG